MFNANQTWLVFVCRIVGGGGERRRRIKERSVLKSQRLNKTFMWPSAKKEREFVFGKFSLLRSVYKVGEQDC